MIKVKWKSGEKQKGIVNMSNADYSTYRNRVILLQKLNQEKCEHCNKSLIWGVDVGMFQCGISRRFWHYTKKKKKVFNTATFCSKTCINEWEKLNEFEDKLSEKARKEKGK